MPLEFCTYSNCAKSTRLPDPSIYQSRKGMAFESIAGVVLFPGLVWVSGPHQAIDGCKAPSPTMRVKSTV